MRNKVKLWFGLAFLTFQVQSIAQSDTDTAATPAAEMREPAFLRDRPEKTDNNLTFDIVSEKIRERGMMKVCITDTSLQCIANLQSGFVIRVYNSKGEEIWAGKSAGRDEMLKFPAPMKDAAYITLKAFKPYVLNKYTGTRIYQDKPIEIKYVLDE